MINAKCRIKVWASPIYLNYFRRKYHNFAFCILHSAFGVSPPNNNLSRGQFGYTNHKEATAMINIKEKIEQIVEKLKNDEDLLKKFNKNPASVIEEYVGIDLPDDQVNQLVEGIKAKLTLDKIGGALGGLFGKK